MGRVTLYGLEEDLTGNIKVVSVEATETPKYYRVRGRPGWLGYNTMIPKGSIFIHLSAEDAIDKRIQSLAQGIVNAQQSIESNTRKIAKLRELKGPTIPTETPAREEEN